MSLFKLFKTDEGIEKSGIVLQYGKTEDGRPINIRIARAGGSNTRFTKLVEQKTKPYRRQIQNDLMDPKVGDELMMEVFAEVVVLGWENVEEEDGTPIPFNRENCISVFKRLPDLFKDVQEQATKSALFRASILETEAKNS